MPPDNADTKADTFTSVLPGVEDVLECVYKLAEGGDTSIDEVVTKVSQLSSYAWYPSLRSSSLSPTTVYSDSDERGYCMRACGGIGGGGIGGHAGRKGCKRCRGCRAN